MLIIGRKPTSQTSFSKTAKFPSCPPAMAGFPFRGHAAEDPTPAAGLSRCSHPPATNTTFRLWLHLRALLKFFASNYLRGHHLQRFWGWTGSNIRPREQVCQGQVRERPGGVLGGHTHSHSFSTVECCQITANILEMLMTQVRMWNPHLSILERNSNVSNSMQVQ